jgi:hypothetical protein
MLIKNIPLALLLLGLSPDRITLFNTRPYCKRPVGHRPGKGLYAKDILFILSKD